MSRMIRITLGIIVALSSFGCGEVVGPRALLDVTVQLSSDVLAPPGSIQVRVVATNRGANTVRISPYVCPPVFAVYDAAGQKVGPYTPVCLLFGLPPRDLGPDEAFAYEHVWDGRGYLGSLERGTYAVVGEVMSSAGVVRSEAVTVEAS